jgi:hypothetical protein
MNSTKTGAAGIGIACGSGISFIARVTDEYRRGLRSLSINSVEGSTGVQSVLTKYYSCSIKT